MTGPTLPPLAGTATLDITDFRRGTRGALTALREVVDYSRRNGTLTLTARLAGASASAMRAQLTAALGTSALPVTVRFDPASVSAALASLRAQLTSIVSINTSTLTAVQAQIATQITQLTALIAQLRALGGGGGGGGGGSRSSFSAGTQALLAGLEQVNNEYRRGDITGAQYAARLAGIQASLRTAAGAATAGSAEFRALDQAITRTVTGLRQINTDGITKLRTELSGARAQFDAAAAAATTLAQRQAAAATYTAELNRIRVALGGMASSGQLTAQQLGQVNRLLAQTAREANTIRGGINIAGLSGNISNALQQLAGFIPGLSQVTGLMGGLSPAIVGVTLALGAFTVAMGASFRTAAQFQQGIADIKALTQPTAQGLNDLTRAALTMGEPLGVGARAAAAGILELNRAGLSAQQVLEGGLTGALNLAGAAGIQLAEASKFSAAAMTAFKLSSQDLPRVADNFANFANSTFLGAEDLTLAIAAVGPVAVNAGLSIEQFGGIMATAAQGGFKAMNDAGTSLKTMLLSLQSPTENGAAALARIGVNSYDAAGNFRPFLKTISDLRTALAGMSEQGKNNVLRDIFGQDAIRIATILLNSNSEAIEKNVATQGKAGEAARVAKERLDTYQGEVARLSAQFERLRIVLGEKLLPTATKLIQGVSNGVAQLERFANGTDNLLGYVVPLIAAFVGLRGAVIAAAAPAIWASLTTAATAFFTTITAFVASNPLGLLLTAVAALAAGMNKIMNDTARIYAEMDQQSNSSFEQTMARVKALNAQNTELSRAQARQLLLAEQLRAAEEGTVTGVNIFGERTITVDTQRVEQLRKELQGAARDVVVLRTEANRRSASGGQVAALDPAKVKEQSEAVRNLRATLTDRAFQLKIGGLDGVEKEVAQVGKAFDDLRKKLKSSFGGNLNSTELKGALAELAQAQAKEEAAVRARYAQEQAKERAKDYAQAAAQARQGAFDTQRAEIQAMQEGRARTQAERRLALAELQDSIAKQVAEYAKYPDLVAQAQSQGRRQEVALRRQWQREDIEAARQQAQAVASAEGEARAALIAALPDSAEKTRLEREQQLQQVRQGVQDRLKVLAGHPAAQQRILTLGRQQEQALQAGWAREDQQAARERAARIAQAFATAQDATLKAQAAARDVLAAQLDLDTARRVAQARGNAEQIARIELDGQRQRLALQERAAQAERAAQRQQLDTNLRVALAAEGLTTQERAALQRTYYAQVAELDQQYTAGQIGRTQEREQAELDATEKIRAARVTLAQRGLTGAQDTLRDVEQQRALADTAAQRLVAEQRVAAAQQGVIQAGRTILTRARELNLTEEERTQIQGSITEAQRAQAQQMRTIRDTQREVVDEARALRDSYLDVVDAQVDVAARLARTNGQAAAAEAQRLQVVAARLAALDDRISSETDATKRNGMITQRVQLLGQLAEAQLTAGQRQRDTDTQALDLTEARLRAQARVQSLADDAVASAQLDLDLTRQRLTLTQRQLRDATLSADQRTQLLRQEAELTGQIAEQQRTLVQAERDRVTLTRDLARAQETLRQAAQGGTEQARAQLTTQTALVRAREDLTRAEREYADAQAGTDLTRQRTATDTLTAAIQTQRGALRDLADQYTRTLTSMAGVQEAATRLNTVVYGEAGQPFNSQTERQRLTAIEQRRDAARQRLVEALTGGDAEAIAAAVQAFSAQEERYRKQADRLEKQGVKFTRTGQVQAQQLADQVDALGIQYDREALLVQERQRAANQEMEAAVIVSDAMTRFGNGVQALRLPTTFSPTAPTTLPGLDQAVLAALRALPTAAPVTSIIPTTQPITNISTSWEVDVTVHAAPGQSPQQIADQVISTLQDRVRRNGRNC